MKRSTVVYYSRHQGGTNTQAGREGLLDARDGKTPAGRVTMQNTELRRRTHNRARAYVVVVVLVVLGSMMISNCGIALSTSCR